MTENVKNIIDGINETNKSIAENQVDETVNTSNLNPMYSGLANGSAYQIYGDAAQDFPAD